MIHNRAVANDLDTLLLSTYVHRRKTNLKKKCELYWTLK